MQREARNLIWQHDNTGSQAAEMVKTYLKTLKWEVRRTRRILETITCFNRWQAVL